MTFICIEGNLTRDPVLRFLESGVATCSMGVAVNRRGPDGNGGFEDKNNTFWNVQAWRSLAENCADSLHKGDRVIVVGRVESRSYEFTPEGATEAEERTVIEITAESIGPDLRWASIDGKVLRNAKAEHVPGPTEADAPFPIASNTEVVEEAL